MQHRPSPPLSRQLQAAADFVGAVLNGQSSAQALAPIAPDLHAATQSLGFAALRGLGRAQTLLSLLAHKKPPPAAEHLLLVALALLSAPGASEADGEGSPHYEDFTLVNQTVAAAKAARASQGQAPFINACLRRFLREREALLAQALSQPLARWNHPAWWIAQVKKDHPTHWQTVLQASHRKAPLILRVRPSHTNVALRVNGQICSTRTVGEFALALDKPVPVQQIEGFDQGAYSVQDSAAQMAAPLLLRGLARLTPPQRPWRVLDACAAPGGKTVHLLEWAAHMNTPIEVTALDVDAKRCERITQNLNRCGLTAKVLAADAAKPGAWWDGQPFDAILLDAPCTASGIVRRHPDVAWLRRFSDVAQLARIQSQLLDTLWPLLAPGGFLLYCTCSVFKAEGQDQVTAFLSRNTAARLQPSPGHLLPGVGTTETLLPDNPDMNRDAQRKAEETAARSVFDHDGFFYALFRQAVSQQDATPS